MSFATRNLRESVTWWAVTADGFGGFTFSAPTALQGRWEDRQELFRDPIGDERVSNAIVYLDTDVLPGDYLYHGTSTEVDPTTLNEGAIRVMQFNKIPDLRNLHAIRKAFL